MIIKTFKKYGNRKIYDCQRSQYATHGDIVQDIQSGTTVRIISNRTGDDLTREVLHEIMVGWVRGNPSETVLSLHDILKSGGGELLVRQPTNA